ncbi:MAG: polyketide cyclase [Flavobacteriaceae bacterium]|nr:MAG: polyketide cyclase [Flavobacteriaceae bacterium]
MTTLFYILGGLILLIIILSLLAPKTYKVSRSVEISKPKAEIFKYLLSLKNMDEWSPWAKRDPNMKHSYTGTDGEVGFISRWVGNKDVGEGEQEITKIVDGERIETQLRFLKPWKSVSDAFLSVDDSANGKIKVSWGFTGKNKFPMTIMAMFINMDKMIGKDFEEGLASLKSIMEK